jgi:hypothetical protein
MRKNEQPFLTDNMLKKFKDIKKVNPDALTVMTDNQFRRREHVTIFSSLLLFLKNNLFMITDAMYELFIHLILTENAHILAAYEVYLVNQEVDDFVDTLFLIFR